MGTRAVFKSKATMDNRQFKRGVKDMSRSVDTAEKKSKKFGAALKGAFAVGAIASVIKSVFTLGSVLSDQATQTGLSTDAFQALELATRQAGAKSQQLVSTMVRLKDAQGRVIEGDEMAIDAFERLGIAQDDVINMGVAELFELVSKKLTESGNSALEFSSVVELIGTRNAPKMLEVMNRISEEGLGTFIDKAKAAGNVMSEDVIAKMDEAADKMDTLTRTLKVAGATLANYVIGTFQDFGTILGSLSGVGFSETVKQIKSGELLGFSDGSKIDDQQRVSKEEKAELEKEARIAAARRMHEKKIAEERENANKKAVKNSARVQVEELRRIGGSSGFAVVRQPVTDPLVRQQLDTSQQQLNQLQLIANNTRDGGGLG